MVDLHIHILPGIDDGAKSLKESVEMARMSAAGGVRAVSATSHGDFSFYEPEEYLKIYGKKLEDFCRALKEEQIPLEVHRGMELMVNESLLKAGRKGPLPGYGGSRRLLVEFFFDISRTTALKWTDELLAMGASWENWEEELPGQQTGFLAGGWQDWWPQTLMIRCCGRRIWKKRPESWTYTTEAALPGSFWREILRGFWRGGSCRNSFCV